MIHGYTSSMTFAGSLGVSFISPGTKIELHFGWNVDTATHSIFTITVGRYVGLPIFIGGIIFFNAGRVTTNNIFYNGGSRLNAESFLRNSSYELYGPPFNTKCIIGFNSFNFGQDFSIKLVNITWSNNYYKILMETPLPNTMNFFDYHFGCVAAKTPIICGDYEYEDPLTGECFTSSNACPVATTSFISLTAKNWCKKCAQPQCLDCVAATRSTCLDCD
jgi:hypothetical protein